MRLAGGLAEPQKASGAELWASEASADTLATGGDDDESSTYIDSGEEGENTLRALGVLRWYERVQL